MKYLFKFFGVLIVALMVASCTYYSVYGDIPGNVKQVKDRQVDVSTETEMSIKP